MINSKKELAKEFWNIRQGIEMIYDDYARFNGISYTTLYVLHTISQFENCTQKKICENSLLPKQTVNNIVKNLLNKNYIKLSVSPVNHREKVINFTEDGKKYAYPMLSYVEKAECEAMNALTPLQQKEFMNAIKIYDSAFRKAMLKNNKKRKKML